jgi:hypothetical protein
MVTLARLYTARGDIQGSTDAFKRADELAVKAHTMDPNNAKLPSLFRLIRLEKARAELLRLKDLDFEKNSGLIAKDIADAKRRADSIDDLNSKIHDIDAKINSAGGPDIEDRLEARSDNGDPA